MKYLRNLIEHRYGSNRGFYRFIRYNAGYHLLNEWNRFKNIPEKIDRVVFVCKGNICRSPLAEEVFRRLGSIDSVSFGLDTRTGFQAHPPIVEASLAASYNISDHKTTFIDDFEAKDNDLYVCFEPDQAVQLEILFETKDIVLLGFFAKPLRVYIHDPYSASDEYIVMLTRYIIDAVNNLAAAIDLRINYS